MAAVEGPSRARAYALMFASALCGGASVVAGKIGVGGTSVPVYVAWLFVFSTAFTLLGRRLERPETGRPVSARGRRLVLLHVACAGLGCWGWYAGLLKLGAGVAALASRAEVLVSITLGIVLLGERLRRLEVLGGVVALGGLALLCLPASSVPGEGIGFAWILLGALAFGSSEIPSKLAVAEVGPTRFVLARSVLLALVWTGVALGSGAALVPAPWVLAAAATAALLGPVVARWFYLHAIRTLPLSRAVLLAQVQPLLAALFGWLVLGDSPRPLQWAGGVLLLAGTMLVVRGARVPAPVSGTPAADGS